MRWFGRVDRYVLSLFVSSYATSFLLVVGLFIVLDMSQNLDEYVAPMKDGSAKAAGMIVRYYLFSVPFVFLQVGPFVTLVAGLFTLGKLVKLNEIVAILGAGVSARRILAPLIGASILVALGSFGLRELLAVGLADRRDALHFVLLKGLSEQVHKDLHLRDAKGTSVSLGEFHPRTAGAGPPEIVGLEAQFATASRWTTITATRATWDRTARVWRLENGLRNDVQGVRRTEAVEVFDDFDFTPELALTYVRADQPLDLSFREARELSRRDPDNVVYQTLLHYDITSSLANVVLLLVGLPLLMRHERGRAVITLASALALCVGYFAADFVCRKMGLQGALDPPLAAWLPILFFGSLGITLYDSMSS